MTIEHDKGAVIVVTEGQVIGLPSGFPIENRQHVVKVHCDNGEGQWACVSHQLVHRNNLSASIHESFPGDHLIAWVCYEHGPEVP